MRIRMQIRLAVAGPDPVYSYRNCASESFERSRPGSRRSAIAVPHAARGHAVCPFVYDERAR